MELLIIRHGLPERIVNDDPGVPADPALDATGRRQAELLSAYLADERIDAIYTSPLRRAIETAAPLATRTGITPQVRDGIAEWDRSSSAYIPIEEMKAQNLPEWQAMQSGQWAGEGDPEVFRSGVLETVAAIVDAHPKQRVAVVCHGGVINSYLTDVLGLSGYGSFFHPEYTSIHRVLAASTGQRSIKTINETAHLRGTGLIVNRV